MTRKLFSTLLCAFALLLLMGAGKAPEQQPASLLAEEESAAASAAALETNLTSAQVSGEAVPAAAGASPISMADSTDSGLLVDGVHASADVGRYALDGVTYVALAPMALALDPSAQVSWDAGSATATVTTSKLSLTARAGQLYLVANGPVYPGSGSDGERTADRPSVGGGQSL